MKPVEPNEEMDLSRPKGCISKRNAAVLADALFLQASALTRYSLSG